MTSNKMDEKLRQAAVRGDVDYLRECVGSNKPVEYYLTFFPEEDDHSERRHWGNIFHMAARENQEEFIREAIRILPPEAMQQLLLQPWDKDEWNPLHVAAKVGNVEIVSMFLHVFRCLPTLPSDLTKRPWLMKTSSGYNPCLVAVAYGFEECALEIFKMENMPTVFSSSLVLDAIFTKMSKLALQILRSPHPISCSGNDYGNTPFHIIHYIEGLEGSEEIFPQLLQRDPELIKQTNMLGYSAFHTWACYGKMWPYKILLECNDIIPDVNKVFTDLVSSTTFSCDNPLHFLAYGPCDEDAKQIAEMLIGIYLKESPSISINQHPWLVKNKNGDTPLTLAITERKENLAKYLMSVDENAVIESEKNVMFMAVEKECHAVAEEILTMIDNKGWTQLLTNDRNLTVLHLAPLCTENLCARLIEGHPGLIKKVDKKGSTIVHFWIKSDKEWLFKFILESKWKVPFVKLIDVKDYNSQNNPFHVAATSSHEATNQIVQLLVEAYKKNNLNWDEKDIDMLPWFEKNKENEGPLHLAIRHKREDLALYILSLVKNDYYMPEHSTLFLAMENNCVTVAKFILENLDKDERAQYLKNFSDGRNILHLATNLVDEKFGTFLVNEEPEFITEKDSHEQSSWDKAFELGRVWFIQAALEKKPTVFDSEPLPWIKACKNGHVSALRAFIDHNPREFLYLCIEHKDSPLHHIKLSSLKHYEEFLKIPRMMDLINLQDSTGATPLHKAIQNADLLLTETLLTVDTVLYDIKNDENVSAIDLLAQKCEDNQACPWDRMCKRHGLNPKIKTTYFRAKTNLLDVRNSLFVVAALLATITFTAGFTPPGGFTQETGEAILAKKAAFLVFLVSDTLALFFSMLVLICLIWSMVYESSQSLFLIDRSMVLLRFALNNTLLAFMTGVYIVIAPKSLWAAIFIIVIVSFLIGISISKTLLYKALSYLDKFFPSQSMTKCRDRFHLMELGCISNKNE